MAVRAALMRLMSIATPAEASKGTMVSASKGAMAPRESLRKRRIIAGSPCYAENRYQ